MEKILKNKKNIITLLRKPKLAVLIAILMLYVSCEQYDLKIVKHSFDYTAYEHLKSSHFSVPLEMSNTITDFFQINKGLLTTEFYEMILDSVNNEYGSNIYLEKIPPSYFQFSAEEIFSIGLDQGYMNLQSVEIHRAFSENIKNETFEYAIYEYESTVLELDLTHEEFEKFNTFANVAKSLYDSNPTFFAKNNSCILAIISYLLAIVGLVGGCLILIFCIVAILAFLFAVFSLVESCIIHQI